ncbi:MAG TPA: hypothetical protein PKD32_07365 [Saprospiraceae bacterium]|nr:hypothetical protein [Saprospiraceae bacterium]
MQISAFFAILIPVSLFSFSCSPKHKLNDSAAQQKNAAFPGEQHFKNVRQMTFGGNNAEAYWSFDDKKLCFQSDNVNWGAQCDQIYYFKVFDDNLKDNLPKHISIDGGRTTCSFFMPGDKSIIFASTQHAGKSCPEVPPRNPGGKYVWPIYKDYEIYTADLKGKILKQYTHNEFYDAEATVSPKGDKIVFTSDRSGDLELYVMNIDGTNVTQVTSELGYDGGAFFSPDGKKLVFRASRPKTPEDQTEYKELLKKGLVQPTQMELFTCNIDGSNMRQITHLGKANWAPFFHPSGNKIIFSSNHNGPKGYNFNLFMINEDGSGLEQISYDQTFDSFPMFSRNGKYLVFASNRENGGTHDTNLFLAEWKD